jgi:hypothetical protein
MNSNSNSNYETLYGVHLLDDLHNFFPALLYDSSSFRNVQDVLGYIQRQTRSRFDLFSYGLREYVSTIPQAPASVASYRQVVQTSSSVPPQTSTVNSTLPTPPPRATNIQVDVQTILQHDEEDEEEPLPTDTITRALLSLLQIPATTLTRNYILPNANNNRMAMDRFLQPVEVRPTAEQIAANTTVGNLVSDTEHSCAICQDALTAEQEGRKLNACGHWFHRGCIDTWLNTNVHCPVCRHDIREPLQSEEQE